MTLKPENSLVELYRVKVISRVVDGELVHDVSRSTPNIPEVEMALPGVLAVHERALTRMASAKLVYDVSRFRDNATGREYFSGSMTH